MNELEPISTPMKLQWRRVRYQLIPLVSFLACATITGILWKRHVAGPNTVGEVYAVTSLVTMPADGQLTLVKGKQIEPFDKVRAGQVVAKMDDTHYLNLSRSQERELERLRKRLQEKQEILTPPGSATRPTTLPANIDLAVLKTEINALEQLVHQQENLLQDTVRMIQACTIVAPFDGTVAVVYARPGQNLRQGREIMTITADSGTHIVSYVRHNSAVKPAKDMVVDIRTNNKQIARSKVTEVGGQIERVPDQQLSNPRFPEWGVPVRIAMPSTVELKPGEMVGLVYRPGEKQ